MTTILLMTFSILFFLNEYCISIKISQKLILKNPADNKPSLVQIIAC